MLGLQVLAGSHPVPGSGTAAGTPSRQGVLPLQRFNAVVRRCRHRSRRADRHACRPPPQTMTSARPVSAAAIATSRPSTERYASFPCTAAGSRSRHYLARRRSRKLHCDCGIRFRHRGPVNAGAVSTRAPARAMARPRNDGRCSPPMTGLPSQVSMSCSTCASAVSTSTRRQRPATPACTCSAMASSTLDSRARWRIRCNGRIAPEADSANRTSANPALLASVRATASTSAMNPWRRKPCAASTSASNRAATRGSGRDGVPLQLPREDQRALAGLGRRENLPAAAHRSGGRLHYGMISASARRSRMAMPAWSVSRRSRIAYGAENSPSTVPGQFRVRPCAPGSSQAAE